MIYSDGEVYEGQYLMGKKCGRGRETYPSGEVYEGSFVNDIKNGKGLH